MVTSSSTDPSKAQVAFAATTIGTPINNAISRDVERDLRIAGALRKRRIEIRDEMESCLRQRAAAYSLADAFLDEFEELADRDKGLRRALAQVEQRLHGAEAYFVSDEQADIILNEIADVGADTRRFCAYMGVPAIAKIPAHEFDVAMAVLHWKRRRAA
jgi:hypothetical protein